MKNNRKNMLIATAVLAICIVLASSSTSIQGRGKTYEIRPEITLPEQKTDTNRFIEGYEQIIQHLMTTNERSQLNLTDDITNVSEKLESMDNKLDDILTRLQKIEKALNIDKKTTTSVDNNATLQNNNTLDN